MAKTIEQVTVNALAISVGAALTIVVPGAGALLGALAASAIIAGGNAAINALNSTSLGSGTPETTPIGPWSYIYGTCKVLGAVKIFEESNNSQGTSNDKQLHRVYALACHPCTIGSNGNNGAGGWSFMIDGKQVLMKPSGTGFASFSPNQYKVNINSINRVNGLVTMVLAAPITGVSGTQLQMRSVADNTFNGTFIVTQPNANDATTFTYVCGGTNKTTAGGNARTCFADYKDKVFVAFLNGSHKATFPDLIASGTSWGPTDLGLGRTLMYVRMGYDSAVFPSSIPNVAIVIQGKNDIFDPRLNSGAGGRAWTANAALCIADFLSLPPIKGGFGLVIGTDIPTASLTAAANVCDLPITLQGPGGGTEAQYTCNTCVQLSQTRGAILQDMLTSCGGRLSYQGGTYNIIPAQWYGSSLALTDADFVGPIHWEPRLSIRDTCNAVKGTYLSPENSWQQSDYPMYMSDVTHAYPNDQWLIEDNGERIIKELSLPCTSSSATAQRLAKIDLMRTRFQGRGTIRTSMRGYQAIALDVINITHARYGWSNKLFEVLSSRFIGDKTGDAPVLYCELDIAETGPTVVQWSTGDQLTPQGYASPTNVGVQIVSPPEALIVYSGPGETVNGQVYPSTISLGADGVSRNSLYVTWTNPNDAYVTNGGSIEVQFQFYGATVWTAAGSCSPTTNCCFIPGVNDNVGYNVQVRAVNCAGVPSDWVADLDTVVSATASVLNASSITYGPGVNIATAILAAQTTGTAAQAAAATAEATAVAAQSTAYTANTAAAAANAAVVIAQAAAVAAQGVANTANTAAAAAQAAANTANTAAGTAQTAANTANTAAGTAQAAAVAAQGTANTANATANAASTGASTANAAIGNISSDNVLSTGEKSQVILDWNSVTGEYADINTKAASYAVSTASYDASEVELSRYLGAVKSGTDGVGLGGGIASGDWQNLTTNSAIDGPTFRGKWTSYYTARQLLLNAVSAQALALANTAQGTANTAATAAGTAQSAATTAQGTANTANSAAGTAQTAANSANSAAGVANTAAGTAQTTANTANTAAATANTAAATANTAAQMASSAGTSESLIPNGSFSLGSLQGWFLCEGSGVFSYGALPNGSKGLIVNGGSSTGVGSPTFQVVPGQSYQFTYNCWAGSGSQLVYLRVNFSATYQSQITSGDRSGNYDFVQAGTIPTVLTPTATTYKWVCPAGIYYASAAVYAWTTTVATIYCSSITCTPYGGVGQWGADVTGSNTAAGSNALGGTSAATVLANIAAAEATAVAAQNAASAAQTTANTATTGISTISSDNVLSTGEKSAIISDWNAILAEEPGIASQAGTNSVSSAAYTAAYNVLSSYLTSAYSGTNGVGTGGSDWSNVATNSTIDGPTFRSTWAAYYTARQALLNLIAASLLTTATNAGAGESIVPNGTFSLGTSQGWLGSFASYTAGVGFYCGPGGGYTGAYSPSFAVVPNQKYRISFQVFSNAGATNTILEIIYAATYSANISSSTFHNFLVGTVATTSTSYSYDWQCPAGVYFASLRVQNGPGDKGVTVSAATCIPYGAAAQWGADQTSAHVLTNMVSGVTNNPAIATSLGLIPEMQQAITAASSADAFLVLFSSVFSGSGGTQVAIYLYVDGVQRLDSQVVAYTPTGYSASAQMAYALTGLSAGTHTLSIFGQVPAGPTGCIWYLNLRHFTVQRVF